MEVVRYYIRIMSDGKSDIARVEFSVSAVTPIAC
jgi:hypothetical protein